VQYIAHIQYIVHNIRCICNIYYIMRYTIQ
jgi:hypothetical protein